MLHLVVPSDWHAAGGAALKEESLLRMIAALRLGMLGVRCRAGKPASVCQVSLPATYCASLALRRRSSRLWHPHTVAMKNAFVVRVCEVVVNVHVDGKFSVKAWRLGRTRGGLRGERLLT